MSRMKVNDVRNPFGKLPLNHFEAQADIRPIMRLSHARSRYIYDLYYKRELITRELYDWLIKQGYADAK
jgi:hypothetical protein